MAAGEGRYTGLILTLAAVSFISAVVSIDDRCAACTAIAKELDHGLSNERPKNHLDMRNRLNSKGQREGKVIDYRKAAPFLIYALPNRVSDLRIVELLDGLCEKMEDYTLEKIDSGTQKWIKVNNWDNLKTSKQEAKAHSKAISSFCGRLLEDTEDKLSELIKKEFVKVGEVNKVLCEDLTRHCVKRSHEHDGGHNEDDEL